MIDRGERFPFWRVWLLNARVDTGWGYDLEDLQQWHRAHTRRARRDILIGMAYVVFVILVTYTSPYSRRRSAAPTTSLANLALGIGALLAIALLPALIEAVYSVIHRRRAEAGAHTQPTSTFGECFATATGRKFRFFALVGPNRQQAKWFLLPISWDTTVEPSADHFAVIYNPATGFVSEVTRIGAQSRTLPADAIEKSAPVERAPGHYGDATKEQRRELIRMANRGGPCWGASTGSMLGQCITCAIITVFTLVMAIEILTTARTNIYVKTASDYDNLIVISCALAAMGVMCGFAAVYVFRTWRRFRRADALGPSILEGDQICYTPRGVQKNNTKQGNVLALIARTGDEEHLAVCVPRKLQHRLWGGPGRVRVVYNPASGRVLDLRHSTEPVVERD